MSTRWTYEPSDEALWRRLCRKAGLDLMAAADGMHTRGREITWRDHFAWWLEARGQSLFDLGFNNSIEEECMILNGEIPLHALTAAQQEAFLPIIELEVLFEDFRYDIERADRQILELFEHPAFLRLQSEEADVIRWHIAQIREQLGDLRHHCAPKPELLLLEDRRAA